MMIRLGVVLVCVAAVLDVTTSQGVMSPESPPYNCRRSGFECKNGGTCKDGACECAIEYTSFDCGVSVDEMNCGDNPCQNGGTCYQTDKCYCAVTHYGPSCESETDTWECLGVEMKVNMMVPESFSGSIYGSMSRSDCTFQEETTDVVGYRKFSSSVPFDNSTCAAVEVNDYPMTGDITFITDVVVGFHSFIQTRNDRIISFNCTHPASNVSMEADMDSTLHQRGNLTRSKEKKTYSPVRFHFLDANKDILARALHVGEEFTNMVYLLSTDVYTGLLLEKCVASNGETDTTTEVVLLDKGCPTSDGNLVMQDPPGQRKLMYTPPDFPSAVPATALDMLGFRFYDTKQVFIQCVVKICKAEDEAACAIPACNGDLPGQPARRKRSAEEDDTDNGTDEQTVSGLFTVLEKPLMLPNTATAVTKEPDCFRSSEIIIVIIVMSALVLVMLIACVVLATLIVRSRGKVRKLVENCDRRGLHIPRPQVS